MRALGALGLLVVLAGTAAARPPLGKLDGWRRMAEDIALEAKKAPLSK